MTSLTLSLLSIARHSTLHTPSTTSTTKNHPTDRPDFLSVVTNRQVLEMTRLVAQIPLLIVCIVEACQPDPAAILEKLEHLLSQLRQQVIPQDSQQAPPAEERSKLLRDFLDLSLEEVNQIGSGRIAAEEDVS